jgi:hypothetical protein
LRDWSTKNRPQSTAAHRPTETSGTPHATWASAAPQLRPTQVNPASPSWA